MRALRPGHEQAHLQAGGDALGLVEEPPAALGAQRTNCKGAIGCGAWATTDHAPHRLSRPSSAAAQKSVIASQWAGQSRSVSAKIGPSTSSRSTFR